MSCSVNINCLKIQCKSYNVIIYCPKTRCWNNCALKNRRDIRCIICSGRIYAPNTHCAIYNATKQASNIFRHIYNAPKTYPEGVLHK